MSHGNKWLPSPANAIAIQEEQPLDCSVTRSGLIWSQPSTGIIRVSFVDECNGVTWRLAYGMPGPDGIPGPQGILGEPGPDGQPGAAGAPGDDGSKGPDGDKGPAGDKGPTGDKGPQGDTGNKGETGDKGAAGDQGPLGNQGAVGNQGPVGDKGPTGDKGTTGDKGPVGDKGLIGDKGPTGDQGPAGDPATCWPVGSVFIAVVATNPSTLLGVGTWAALGAGRVLVGYDSGDADFNAAEKTGGAKTVQASAQTFSGTQSTVVVNHTHTVSHSDVASSTTGSATTHYQTLAKTTDTSSTQSDFNPTTSNPSGGAANYTPAGTNTPGAATSVVQPYIVVYIWKRTA